MARKTTAKKTTTKQKTPKKRAPNNPAASGRRRSSRRNVPPPKTPTVSRPNRRAIVTNTPSLRTEHAPIEPQTPRGALPSRSPNSTHMMDTDSPDEMSPGLIQSTVS